MKEVLNYRISIENYLDEIELFYEENEESDEEIFNEIEKYRKKLHKYSLENIKMDYLKKKESHIHEKMDGDYLPLKYEKLLYIYNNSVNSDKYTNKCKQYNLAFDKKISNKTNDIILTYRLIYESKESFDLEEMKKQIKMLEKGLNRLDVYI